MRGWLETHAGGRGATSPRGMSAVLFEGPSLSYGVLLLRRERGNVRAPSLRAGAAAADASLPPHGEPTGGAGCRGSERRPVTAIADGEVVGGDGGGDAPPAQAPTLPPEIELQVQALETAMLRATATENYGEAERIKQAVEALKAQHLPPPPPPRRRVAHVPCGIYI
eukprot:SAG11_NODE_1812_length_4220_cov_3.629944_2_plen_167_part_00